MNELETQPQGSTLNVQDVLFILFRHKWKIIFFGILGVVAAGGVWFSKEPEFHSQAKILVRYVTETRTVNPDPKSPDVVRDPDAVGRNILSAEAEILSSLDSLTEAARRIGPEKLLAPYEIPAELPSAAGLLAEKLKVTLGNSIISVELRHKDPEIVREALKVIVEEYRRRHIEIHRSVGAYEDLAAKADQLRYSLSTTEEELRREKNKVGILSLDQAKNGISEEISSLRKSIFETEAELAAARARIGQFEVESKAMHDSESSEEPDQVIEKPIEPGKILLYRQLAAKLSSLRQSQADLLLSFRKESTVIRDVRDQIAQTEQAIHELNLDENARTALASGGQTTAALPSTLLVSNEGPALEAKLGILNRQLEEAKQRAKAIDAVENTLRHLERKKQIEEDKLHYYESNLERARFDQTIDAGKLNNISLLEAPTPPFQDWKKLQKMAGMAFAGLFGLGLSLAFGLELFLDPSVKRRKDVEDKLGLPLFTSIPVQSARKSRKRNGEHSPSREVAEHLGLARGEIEPWDETDPLAPYYESIRDRIVMSYTGDAHKPKIVGLTSCNPGAGVSRISLGVAAALSRDAERNVLFIGMERDRVSVTSFARGNPREGLRPGADSSQAGELSSANGEPVATTNERTRSDQVVVEKSLQTLARTGHGLSGASVVQSFSELMPKLKACDYDYIIFDLPPISQTSGSLRLASQMERTIFVLEAEKTNREKVARARKLLAGSRAQLFAVLNKAKSYGPSFVNDESAL